MDKSPKIKSLKWGSIIVEGADKAFKDVKLFPGGSREWDWNETGTHHHPGIQPADVRELLDFGAEIIVLSKGHQQRLEIQNETLDLLKEEGVTVHIEETEQAVTIYNNLVKEKKRVGALIHTTC